LVKIFAWFTPVKCCFAAPSPSQKGGVFNWVYLTSIIFFFLGVYSPKRKFRAQIMTVVQKRGRRPVISKSLGKRISVNQTRPIFITKLNRPKVKILKGREIAFKIGLIKKLIIPKTPPIINSIRKVP